MAAKKEPILVSGKVIAEIAGVSTPAVSQAKKSALKGGLCGGKFDLNTLAVQDYCQKQGYKGKWPPPKFDPNTKAKADTGGTQSSRPKKPAPSELEIYENDPEISEVPDMTIRQLLTRFGSDSRFKQWLDAQKVLADVRLKELTYAERSGELMPRSYVSDHIIPFIEVMTGRLVQDVPVSLAIDIAGRYNLDSEDQAKLERVVRAAITPVIKSSKKQVSKAISHA